MQYAPVAQLVYVFVCTATILQVNLQVYWCKYLKHIMKVHKYTLSELLVK